LVAMEVTDPVKIPRMSHNVLLLMRRTL
jgi:hypothetical protein